MSNYYELFGIDKDVEIEIIDEIYERIKLFGVLTHDITEAYEVLSNPSRREAYNKELEFVNKIDITPPIQPYLTNLHDSINVNKDGVGNKGQEESTTTNVEKRSVWVGIVPSIMILIGLVVIILVVQKLNSNSVIDNDNNVSIETPSKFEDEVTPITADINTDEPDIGQENSESVWMSLNGYDNKLGYKDLINNIETDLLLLGYINNQGLNVRSGPGTDFEKVSYLEDEDFVVVFGEYNGWYDIAYFEGDNDKFGWVYKKYLDLFLYNLEKEEFIDYIITEETKDVEETPDKDLLSGSEIVELDKPNDSIAIISDKDASEPTDEYSSISEETILSFFTIGSSKEDVETVMGIPTKKNEYNNSWHYEFSSITFDGSNKVKEYNDISNNLRVSMGNAVTGAYFTLGSTKQDVINAMGTPSEVNIYGNSWHYEFSSITFDGSNKVKEYNDISNNLRVSMGNAVTGAYFTLGSTKQDVINAMGTPSEVNIYGNSWHYEFSSITFDGSNKVKEYNDISNNLRVSMGNAVTGAYFTLGSTKQDVINAMGTPSEVNVYGNSWHYEFSSITFDSANKVKEYNDISGNLRIK